jgi:polar amino acid transport system permease protein
MSASESDSPAAAIPIVPRPRYGARMAALLTALAVIWLGWSVTGNARFEWQTVLHYLFHPLILRGLGTTLLITVVVMIFALIIGTAVALMRSSSSSALRSIAAGYVWLFRGVPALIQLLFWFNLALVLPRLSLDIPGIGSVFSADTNDILSPFAAAVIALSLCQGAYLAEIIRAGFRSTPYGQVEAAMSLGMSPMRILARIIVPQAMRFIIPPTGNEAISLLKMTSLVTYVAVDDLFYAAQSIYARTFETVPLLIVVAFWYLAAVSLMSVGQRYLERYFWRMDAPISPRAAQRVRRVAMAAWHRSGK